MQNHPWPALVAMILTVSTVAGCESARVRHPEVPIDRADIEAVGVQHFDQTRTRWLLGPPNSIEPGVTEGQCLRWDGVHVRDAARQAATQVSDVRVCFSSTGYARSGSIGNQPLPN